MRDLLPAVALLVAACAPVPALSPARPTPRPVLYVDASAPLGGDGSPGRPVKRLPAVVPAGTDVHVLTGLYRGPFVLGDDAHLEGQGEVVLYLEGDGAVLSVPARGSATHLSLQGGALGLLVAGEARAEHLRLSGQREVAARVKGSLTAADLLVADVVEGSDGLEVEGSLALERAEFTGGLRRALRLLPGSRAVLGHVTAEGPKTLLHARDARVDLRDASTSQGAGPALFFSGGEATLDAVRVRGHEYGLQLTSDARVTATAFTSAGALEAAVAVNHATLTLRRSTIGETGATAAIFSQSGTLTLEDVSLRDVRPLGVLVRLGRARLTRCTVERVTADGDSLGDAVMARDAKVEIDGLRVSDVGGSALFASAAAEVTVTGLQVDRAQRSALFVERAASVRADAVLVRGGSGPTVLVPDAASVSIGALSVAGGEVPVYAECDQGARVRIGRLETTIPQPPSRCLTLGDAPAE